jgi:hypothetical protein
VCWQRSGATGIDHVQRGLAQESNTLTVALDLGVTGPADQELVSLKVVGIVTSIPICSSGCHNPLSASFGRPVQRKPAANSSVISVRGAAVNTSMQPAYHRSPVYSLTAAAPHKTGSGWPYGWRVPARASNCKVATKFRCQGALSIGYCIWRVYTCSESRVNPLIFEGQEKSSRAVFLGHCHRDLPTLEAAQG